MKRPHAGWFAWRPVLTPQEKQAAAGIVAALVLGLATKHYRTAHPHIATPPPTAKVQKKRPAVTPFSRPRQNDAGKVDAPNDED